MFIAIYPEALGLHVGQPNGFVTNWVRISVSGFLLPKAVSHIHLAWMEVYGESISLVSTAELLAILIAYRLEAFVGELSQRAE